MFIELHGTTPEDKRTNARAVMAQLRACGYRIYDVEAACYIPEAEPVLEGRVIYTLRTKHRKSPKSKTAKPVSGRE